jgi:hypothetical protein
MDEADVREALKDLPRLTASAGFAAGVRRRIHGAPPRTRGRMLLPVAAVAAAFAFAGVVRLDAVRRERALRRETRALAREIEEMKRTLPSPVVEVGERDGVRYVIDLRRPPGRRSGTL